MPTYDVTLTEGGGRPQAYAGRDILQQMERRNITTKAVVVTQFDRFGQAEDEITLEALDAQLQAAFPVTYVGAVYYNVGYVGWRESLQSIVNQLNLVSSSVS